MKGQGTKIIINLCGPPCGGKSTFSALFTLEHPEFKYCPIDEYRIQHEEESIAWKNLQDDVLNHRFSIIESCGLCWRLLEFFNFSMIRKRTILTILFTAKRGILFSRLKERQKRPLPLPFRPEDEELAIDYVIEEYAIHKTYPPIDYIVDTSERTSQEIYNVVNKAINTNLLYLANSKTKLRKDTYPFNKNNRDTINPKKDL